MIDRPANRNEETVLASVTTRADIAQHEVDEAQASLSRAANLRRLWVGIGEHLAQGRPVAGFLECERALRRSDELAVDDVVLLRDVAAYLRVQVDHVLASVETAMPEAFELGGLRLDPSARHPNYTMESGFITVSIDEQKLVASITSRGGTTRKEATDPQVVAAAAIEVRDRVFRRKASHVTPAKLTLAYRSLVRKTHVGGGDEVPIDAVRSQLSPRGKPIPQDEFNVDLAALIQTASRTGNPKITLSNTRDTRAGLLLHGLEEAGYVGYLKIEGV
jgi:hypothetical protein